MDFRRPRRGLSFKGEEMQLEEDAELERRVQNQDMLRRKFNRD